MREFIVTNKNVLAQELDINGSPIPTIFRWKGKAIIGRSQLADILIFEAEQRIKEKYFDKELKELIKELRLVKPNKNELKKILKFVKFV